MKTTENRTGSALGREITLRIDRKSFDRLRDHVAKDPTSEHFAFSLVNPARTADGTAFIVGGLFLPDEGDLTEQTAGSVASGKAFQSFAYLIAEQRGSSVLDMHTHPFQSVPHFSGIDTRESAKNARYLTGRLAAPATMLMVVFNSDLTAFDGTVYDRSLESFRKIDRLEILGAGNRVIPLGEDLGEDRRLDPTFSRQCLVPGWDQRALARQRVAVVGAGGNGAHVLQTLARLGVGAEGWLCAVDPDIIELSNLPRIPYAFAGNVGCPKVAVAAAYVARTNPAIPFYPYPCSVTEKAAVDRIKGATVIIGAGDGDGVRKFCNELSVRYCIPYIDLGCEIHVGDDSIEAGGQVWLVIPGQTGCLVCCGAFDPSVAALELLDDEAKAVRARQGYIQGSRDQAAPSVANLNAIIAQLGMQVFLSIVHGKPFVGSGYLHFNHLTGQTLVAESTVSDSCPLCGPYGIMAAGDEHPVTVPVEPRFMPMEQSA